MTEQIKSCPFCGSQPTILTEENTACWYVECDCEAQGPHESTSEQAITAWNARPPVTDQATVAKIVALTATLAGVLYSVVWSDYYGIKDDMMANGCEHGFKPASSCPNKNCDKGELERAIDEALRQWEEARNGF